jgi:hypothetical protein
VPQLSINELSILTGKTRATVAKGLDSLPFAEGPKQAKLYDSKAALAKLYLAPSEDGSDFITPAEAQRQLTIARKQQIDLEMEVTRKERIPLDVIEAGMDRIFSNAAGLLKAHAGKELSETLLSDIFAELRRLGEVAKT